MKDPKNFKLAFQNDTVSYKIDKLTPLTSRVFINNYCITFNKETGKLRVYDENISQDKEIFNSEK
jgi:hypothetical protein